MQTLGFVILEPVTEWIGVEYGWRNYALWVFGITIITFPVITLAVIHHLVYIRESRRRWIEFLRKRRLAIDYWYSIPPFMHSKSNGLFTALGPSGANLLI